MWPDLAIAAIAFIAGVFAEWARNALRDLRPW